MKSSLVFLVFSLLFSVADRIAQAQTVLMNESFDSVTIPGFPPAWIGGTGWSSSSSSESPGSGSINVVHTGSRFGLLALPSLDLTGYSSGFISYDARRTSSYDQANLILTASNDSGATYSFTVIQAGLALPVATSTYRTISVPLPDGLFGQSGVILRFEALGGTSSGSNIRFDDVVITASLNNEEPPGGADSTAQSSYFGFRDSSSTALEETFDILIPLTLSSLTPLRGLQFDIRMPGSNARIIGIE